MRALTQMAAALAISCCVAGCAFDGAAVPSAAVTPGSMKAIASERLHGVAPGRSTKADVRAALGDTLAIRFDTGYEVWVYRIGNTRTGEFVILFAPSGVVAKTRVRAEARASLSNSRELA